MPAVPVPPPVPRRRSALALAVAAGVLLPLTGCGSAPEDDEPAGVSGAAQDAAESGRDQVADGGTVRWAVESPPATFNAFATGADATTDRVAGAALPALFTLDSRARPQLNEDYLKSADVTATEPRQTVVYKLNPKARWSDGRAVSAADFKAQWQALNGKDSAYRSARNSGYDRIRQVSAGPKAHEVKVTFARPYADWQSLFTPLYPKSVTGDPKAFNDTSRTALPVSAGPFRVQDGAGKGKKSGEKAAVTLQRNPHWWGDRAKLDKIELRAVPRTDRAGQLAEGKLDLAEIDGSAARRINAAAGGSQGGPAAPDPRAGQAGAEAPVSAMHPPAAAMREWAEAHLSDKARKQAEKADRAERRAEREARAAARKRAAENRQLKSYTVRKALGPAYTQLALNGESGPLQDERVRRAVARAVDRPELAKQALGSYGLPTDPLGSHLRMPDQEGYNDNSGALGGEDVQSAQQLLADSGWKGSRAGTSGEGAEAESAKDGKAQDTAEDGKAGGKPAKDDKAGGNENDKSNSRTGKAAGPPVRMKDGEPLTLRFVLPEGPGSEQARATGKRISRMLNGIGVRTKVKKVGSDSYVNGPVASGEYDLALYSWPGSAYPATDGRPIFAKPEPAEDGSLQAGQNYTRVGTDQIDQLFEKASGELDQGARDDLIKRADARIWAAAGSVPLYQKPQLVAVGDRLTNAGAFGFQTPRYQDIGYGKA